MKIKFAKRIGFVAAAAAAIALLAAGCAPASTDNVVKSASTSASASGTDTSLADVKKAGKITFGTEGTYKPFTYHAGGSGDLTGYDVEVATAIAKQLGVKAEFEETQWDAIFAGLEGGRFDAIANQVSINAERQAKYELSDPYTVSPGVVITTKSNTDINSVADLKGKTTAQSQSSNFYQIAKDAGAKVNVVEGWAQAVALLNQGRIDATVNDKLTFLDYQKTEPKKSANLKIAATTTDESKSAIVTKGGSTSLNAAINTALAKLQADGTLKKLSEKYFGEDVSK